MTERTTYQVVIRWHVRTDDGPWTDAPELDDQAAVTVECGFQYQPYVSVIVYPAEEAPV